MKASPKDPGTNASRPTSTRSRHARRQRCASRAILLDYRTHGDALWARFGQGQGIATRIYYRELAAAFERERDRMGEHASPMIDELRRAVDAITALAEEHQGPDQRTMFRPDKGPL
jgi:hypothetical protein